MKKKLLLIALLFLAIHSYGQDQSALHYIKFFHIGEKIMPVHMLAITYQQGEVKKDSAEMVIDTLPMRPVVTDEKSYWLVSRYLKKAGFKLGKRAGKLEFGTFKIIEDGKYFFLPDYSVTDYFKKMVMYLKKSNADPALVHAIIDNYPWVFNP